MSVEALQKFLKTKTGKAYLSLDDAKEINANATHLSYMSGERTYSASDCHAEVGFMIEALTVLGSTVAFRRLPAEQLGFTQSEVEELLSAYIVLLVPTFDVSNTPNLFRSTISPSRSLMSFVDR